MSKSLAPPPAKITFTACCGRCKDVFTVWGVIKRKQSYIEPQSRIFTYDENIHSLRPCANSSNLISLKQKLYHHCGHELRFFPDYRFRS